MSQFGTFWQGPSLSAFEAACLHSFVAGGHAITLFSYEPVACVPPGVRLADAADIAPQSLMPRFVIDGTASISHFSDYFRYVMFRKTPLTWVDTDILLMRSWEQRPSDNLLALETPSSICNAVMRIGSDESWLPQLIAAAEALMDTRMRWGETGPRLITQLVGRQAAMRQAHPPQVYFPVHFDDFWKMFLPEYRDDCEMRCTNARTVHLWNNIVERLGFWKEYLPPAGSYLHQLFLDRGCGPLFRGEFPLKNMKQLIENWRSRQTGSDLGIRSIARQVLPSIGRTYRHYAG